MSVKTCMFCHKENPDYATYCKRCDLPLVVSTREPEERLQIYRKAAELGYAAGQYNLGFFYAKGMIVPQDYAEAYKWYRKAAEQGYAPAQQNLGALYEDGKGVAKNPHEAVRWYRKAADQGYAQAQAYLGMCYKDGIGVTKDIREAVKWYRKAAEQGNADAQNSLGMRYHYGEGVPQDYSEALKWYRKAADQENQWAQHNLGVLYKNGQGVPKDIAEAMKWYQKAADQGNKAAKTALEALKKQGAAPDEPKKESPAAVREPKKETPDAGGPSIEKPAEPKTETLEELLQELNSMIGLAGAKQEVEKQINRIRIAKNAEKLGSKRVFSPGTLHLVFTGNPGTGKTTVARLLGRIYGSLGVLKKPDVFVECGRDDLVGQYIGHTAARVKDKFEQAKGGVLFIDEAYSLYKKDDPKDYGHEAVNAIVQYMEAMRDEIMVIVAGYRKEMAEFIREANPGLTSRFRTTIHFDDYSQSELMQILESMIRKDGMSLTDGARETLEKVIRRRAKRPNFGNARGVRNLFEDLKELHDTRLAEMMSQGRTLDAAAIDCITAEDAERLPGLSRAEELNVSELLSELDSMVGLDTARQQLRQQVAIVQTQLNAEKAGVTGLKGVGPQHMIFAGNPGTGKTTVARLVAKIYEALGLVADSSIFVECGRSDLVGQFVGQTAPKVRDKVQEALGGILFIDEAYSLFQSTSGSDFGQEAISELVKEMENHRDDLIVIMAGYTQDMKNMIENANAGLKSRFPVWLDFDDYSVTEMVRIFQDMITAKGYRCDDGNGLVQKLIEEKSAEPGFGNARGVRNLADRVITAQSMRLSGIGFENIRAPEDYSRIEDADLILVMNQKSAFDGQETRKIGF